MFKKPDDDLTLWRKFIFSCAPVSRRVLPPLPGAWEGGRRREPQPRLAGRGCKQPPQYEAKGRMLVEGWKIRTIPSREKILVPFVFLKISEIFEKMI